MAFDFPADWHQLPWSIGDQNILKTLVPSRPSTYPSCRHDCNSKPYRTLEAVHHQTTRAHLHPALRNGGQCYPPAIHLTMSCQLLEFLEVAWKKEKANYPIRSSLIYPAFFQPKSCFVTPHGLLVAASSIYCALIASAARIAARNLQRLKIHIKHVLLCQGEGQFYPCHTSSPLCSDIPCPSSIRPCAPD